ncbi:MAG: prepilin-type N-terminal cleavage/methylation domain-containing protein, partial [Bdellovibrionales bacterium]|nr:prepilin-type N-terminal cleavage/methylation domain-containing protein [Bdellovibrionales bacterium]
MNLSRWALGPNKSRGFSLPEVMVSIAIIGVTALGISRLFISGAAG